MQGTAMRDLFVGLFVAAGFAGIAYLSFQVGGVTYTGPGGMQLVAVFDEIGALSVRAPVVIAGVKVGRVTGIELDETLRARVMIDVDASLELPIDSSAAIRTSGILGDQFIALEAGAEEDFLTSGEQLEFTENAFNLEALVGALVHGTGDDE